MNVRVNIPTLTAVRKNALAIDSGAAAALFNQWAVRYSAFVRRRFNTFSRGGGTWAPLALSTIAARRPPARRKGKVNPVRTLARDTARGGRVVRSPRKTSILRDTGQLLNALTIGANGNVKEGIPSGVRFGIGGGQYVGSKKPITIGRLAAIHQTGNSRLPARPIIVAPTPDVTKSMADDLSRFIMRSARGAR